MVSKNNLCSNSPKGLYEQLRIIKICSGYPMSIFIKLNSHNLKRWDA